MNLVPPWSDYPHTAPYSSCWSFGPFLSRGLALYYLASPELMDITIVLRSMLTRPCLFGGPLAT